MMNDLDMMNDDLYTAYDGFAERAAKIRHELLNLAWDYQKFYHDRNLDNDLARACADTQSFQSRMETRRSMTLFKTNRKLPP